MAAVHCVPDSRRRSVRVVMFPEAKHQPTCSTERLVGLSVPLHRPGEFRTPELAVRPRGRTMLRTRMPEAPVDEHCDSGLAEHQVCGSGQFRKRPGRDPVAKTHAVDSRPHCPLGAGVPAAIGPHGAAGGVGRGPALRAVRPRCAKAAHRRANLRDRHPRRCRMGVRESNTRSGQLPGCLITARQATGQRTNG